MKRIIVEKTNKKSLIDYLIYTFPALSMSTIYKALRNKDIRVNGIKINKNILINENDILDIYIDDRYLFNLPKNIDIIYEDANILVVFKPQGLLSNNEEKILNKNIEEPTFEYLVKNICKEAIICHRLDRNTSGLLIFAKNDKISKEVLEGFKNGYITKEYIAYVHGTDFSKKHDILEKYLLKDKNSGFCKVFDYNIKNSQKIITEYFVKYINKELNYCVLSVIIHTGKTHQIRAQLKDISHPIIGDSKYGKNEINKKFKTYKQLLFAVRYTFNFPKNSPLYYLNDKEIKLDKKYYDNLLGNHINS